MNVVYYPDNKEIKQNSGPMCKFLLTLARKQPQVWSLLNLIIKQIKREDNLDQFVDQEVVSRLRYLKVPIHEIKAPKRRRGGVARVYFGFKEYDNNTIICLAGEFKKNWKSTPNPTIIKQAIKRYKQECL